MAKSTVSSTSQEQPRDEVNACQPQDEGNPARRHSSWAPSTLQLSWLITLLSVCDSRTVLLERGCGARQEASPVAGQAGTQSCLPSDGTAQRYEDIPGRTPPTSRMGVVTQVGQEAHLPIEVALGTNPPNHEHECYCD